ncbi:MAG: hypothetical protein LKJ16_07215, partial [Lactobacillus delbrueckii]|nr:hypothetical protein [Lactobacillus delbrueckii]
FTPPEVHARGYIAITSSLIEYLLAKLLSFQGFIVLFGVGSLSKLHDPCKIQRSCNGNYLRFSKMSNFSMALQKSKWVFI